MNKSQVIQAVAEELGGDLTPREVKACLEAFENVVIRSCKAGDPVALTGFVKFARVDRPARMGRNPATGETIRIAAKSVAKATALKRFKDEVMAGKAKGAKAPAKKAAAKKAPAKKTAAKKAPAKATTKKTTAKKR